MWGGGEVCSMVPKRPNMLRRREEHFQLKTDAKNTTKDMGIDEES